MFYSGSINLGHWGTLIKERENFLLYNNSQEPIAVHPQKLRAYLKQGTNLICVGDNHLQDQALTVAHTHTTTSTTTATINLISNITSLQSPRPSTSKTCCLGPILKPYERRELDKPLYTGSKRKNSDSNNEYPTKQLHSSNNFFPTVEEGTAHGDTNLYSQPTKLKFSKISGKCEI